MITGKVSAIILVLGACCLSAAQSFPVSRDPLKWPFAQNSCWNMPIGSNAVYVPAGIRATANTEWRPDMDIIVMKPKARMTKIYYSNAGWGGSKNRCAATESTPRFSVPIPDSFVIGNEITNASAAFLDSNGRTVKQCQPFARCKPFDSGTSMFFFNKPMTDNGVLYNFHDMDIYDSTGEIGGHWGSKLSDLGGTIRVGEFTAGVIRHAMKVNLNAHVYYYYDFNCPGTLGFKDSCSFRWPAISVDIYATKTSGSHWYAGKDPNFIMGVLLALKPSFNLDTLRTVPGKILGKAFQDYGAYVVDDAFCDCWAPVFERGPDGNVVDEVNSRYGVNMFLTPHTDEFWKDMVKIFENLHIIINNGPRNIGGGGTPRQPLAPPFIGTGTRSGTRAMKPAAASFRKITVGMGQKNLSANVEATGRLFTIRGERVAAGRTGPGSASRLPAGVYLIKNNSVH
jgi:hypothetical protein